MLKIGDKAPQFCLEGLSADGEEKKICLKDLLAEKKDLILYFYPKDNTPGCTTEACDFRDRLPHMENGLVVGISKDSLISHKKFREKHNLNFILLSDPEHSAMEAYGAWGEKNMYGIKTMGCIRSTFIISKDGSINHVWYKVRAKGHANTVIEVMK